MLLRLVIGNLLVLSAASTFAAEAGDPERGLRLMLDKAYLPASFDQETFDELWKCWEEPLRSAAAEGSPEERRKMAFQRYGLVERENDPRGRPLQYVVDDSGNWTMNCLACHQGTVAGAVIPGAPNTHFALETLTEEVRATKLRLGKRLTDLDYGLMMMPLGTTVGTTNAVMFGVALMHFRDEDLKLIPRRIPPRLINHDHDAPPWWNTHRKQRLYADNFAPRGHRALMQFLASKENGPEKFRQWEDDFRHIEAYIDSLEAPKYPFDVDSRLASEGRNVFENNCAACHGTYGNDSSYPELIVPLEEVGTDPLRLQSLSAEHRKDYERNWINEYGKAGEVIADPVGYLAPPLNGIWASAPYLHNGSVPTLWHVLHPDKRPVVWQRLDVDGFDQERVGLVVEELSFLPETVENPAERRTYFDTRQPGKSAAGHRFPDILSSEERAAVLEYLKML